MNKTPAHTVFALTTEGANQPITDQSLHSSAEKGQTGQSASSEMQMSSKNSSGNDVLLELQRKTRQTNF